jgi:hypothetical protein
MSETLNDDDLDRLERYLKKQRIAIRKGEALARDDFVEWVRLSAVDLLDKIEDAWRWVRNWFGMNL